MFAFALLPYGMFNIGVGVYRAGAVLLAPRTVAGLLSRWIRFSIISIFDFLQNKVGIGTQGIVEESVERNAHKVV